MPFAGTVKLPDPVPFRGKIGEIDNWLRHVKWYFKTCGIKYKDDDEEKAISFCLTLFRASALEWAKR